MHATPDPSAPARDTRAGLWGQPGGIDATIRLGPRGAGYGPARLLDALDRHAVAGAILAAEFDDPEAQRASLTPFQHGAGDRLLCVPRLHAAAPDALMWHRYWTNLGCRAVALSSLGAFRSPLRRVDPETIESAPLWRAAAEAGQTLFVEPTVEDAFLLAILAVHFPQVPVVIRGGLVSRMSGASASQPRVLPTPDRFTFARLHQLDNIWIVLAPAHIPIVPPSPTGPANGWHDPANLLALFGDRRILWGSEHRLGDDGHEYAGPGDPAPAFGRLSPREAAALTGGAARRLMLRE